MKIPKSIIKDIKQSLALLGGDVAPSWHAAVASTLELKAREIREFCKTQTTPNP